jgi:hypothetical protein
MGSVGAAPDEKTTIQLPRPRTIVLIGSPQPKEGHGNQFLRAAQQCEKTGPDTMWLVEERGYSNPKHTSCGVDEVKAAATQAGVELVWFWDSPPAKLFGPINRQAITSIKRLVVYSHGIVQLTTLRYNWADVDPGMPDFGLASTEVFKLDPARFAPDCDIELNSCNSGTNAINWISGDEFPDSSLAKTMARRLGKPVKAWTGRTSYHDINQGGTTILPSEIWTDGSRWPDFKEVGSRGLGRVPRLETFNP